VQGDGSPVLQAHGWEPDSVLATPCFPSTPAVDDPGGQFLTALLTLM